jgi:hypothetical protein
MNVAVTAMADTSIPRLRQRAQALGDQMRSRFSELKFELTGETPLNFRPAQGQCG